LRVTTIYLGHASPRTSVRSPASGGPPGLLEGDDPAILLQVGFTRRCVSADPPV